MIELRLIAAPGKVHAAAWTLNEVWGPDWYPLCTGDHIPATEPVAVPPGDLGSQLTCKRCRVKIAANPTWTRPRAAV